MASVFNTLVGSFTLKSRGMNAVDLVNGCPVKLTNLNNSVTVSTIMPMDIWAQNKESIINEVSVVKLPKPAFRNGQMTFTITKAKLAVDQYAAIKRVITKYAAPYAENATCPYCGRGECDTAGLKGAVFVKMHSACQAKDLTGKAADIASGHGNIFLGILLSVLIGSLPYIFSFCTIAFANKYYFILFLSGPFLSGVGYMIKGGYGKIATTISFIISLALFFCFCYFDCAFLIKDAYGVSFGEGLAHPVDVLELMRSSEYLKSRAVMIILFVIGEIIFVASKPLSAENKAKEIADTRALNIPLNQLNQNSNGMF